MLDSKNYYEILEISSEASHDEINREYTRAKNAYSGDSLALYSLMTKEECEEILNLIEEAYTVLSDPHKRRLYNQARGLPAPPEYEQERAAMARDIRLSASEAQSKTNETMQDPNRTNITKLVASSRFALEYTINQSFEQEIEQITVFTGETLQKIREYKNVDINRMSDMTKVSKTYIKNIEADNHGNLPVLVYVRGFVYQYAKCLKLNPDLVANSYIHHLKQIKETT